MSDLSSKQCKVCEKETSPLTREQSEKFLENISSDWIISKDDKAISRTYKFNNYYETMAFANVVAMIAHQQDHHPDMNITYNTCTIVYSTHSISGLSENDFICAAKVDNALAL